MKILLFGKNGQVGWELNRTLLCLGELFALDYPEVDFEKPKDVVKILDEIKPDLIVTPLPILMLTKLRKNQERLN